MANRPKQGDRSNGAKIGRNLRAIYGAVGDAMMSAEPELVDYEMGAPYEQYQPNGVRNFFTGGRYNQNINKLNASSANRYMQQQGQIGLENLRSQNNMAEARDRITAEAQAKAEAQRLQDVALANAARYYNISMPGQGVLNNETLGQNIRLGYGDNINAGLLQAPAQIRANVSRFGVQAAENEALLPGAGQAAVDKRAMEAEKARLANIEAKQNINLPRNIAGADGRNILSIPDTADPTRFTTGVFTMPGYDRVVDLQTTPGVGGLPATTKEVTHTVPRAEGFDTRLLQPFTAAELQAAEAASQPFTFMEQVPEKDKIPFAKRSMSPAQFNRYLMYLTQ